jgi:hypothetical protein
MATQTKTTSTADVEAPDNILANISDQPGLALVPCGLVLPAGLTEEEWTKIGHHLSQAHQRMQWAVGDWWNAFKPQWGERAKLFDDDWTGPTYNTCVNCAAVCNAFEIPRRRGNLTFTHHTEVANAGLTPKQADKL